MAKKSNKVIIWIIVVVVVVVGLYFLLSGASGKNYDSFAKCLTESGAKMYGAFWCGHCESQKKMFGSSWDYATYIECSTPDGRSQTPECNSAGIQRYPTWEFADGGRLTGEQSFEQLSLITGCSLEE